VAELGKWMQNSMVEDIRTENSSRVEEGLVLRMRDGTCSQQVSVEVEAEEMVVVVSHRDLIGSDQIRSWFYKASE